ncbi:MAG: efflux RND transporter periplasmic adaptor subunit [Alphaproteobacteria bacterium]|nr:efflux RND transporter periplasmic adaptor subunit [Alphaproteobacteria bacterium]
MAKTEQIDSAPKKPGRALRWALMGATGLTFVGLMVAGTAALHMRANAEVPPAANPPVSVHTQALKLADSYQITERFAGRLEPARQTQLSFERAGLVRQVMVEEGDKITKGAIVAKLDTAKLEAERQTLKAQGAELQARRDLAAATLKRQEDLNKKGWRSAQNYDEARFSLQEIDASMRRIDASIASLDVDINKSVLRAPFAGTIASRTMDEGAVVAAGSNIVELLETAERHVRIGVSADAAATLKAGETHQFSAAGQMVAGTIIAKRPDLDPRTRTVSVLFSLASQQPLPFGEIVELVLPRSVSAPGTWLPLSALTEGRKGLWSVLTVTQRDGAPVVEREAAEILHIDGDRVYVRGTFTDGTRLLLDGTNRVTPGQQVALAQQG